MKQLLLIILLLSCEGRAYGQRPATQALLDSLTRAIETNRYPKVHAVLISQQGRPVYERYFGSYTADSLHDSRSAFKSITSLLAGIAIDKGFIKDVNQPVYDFFPEYKPFKKWDPRKAKMTLKDLLQMKAGFACEEFDGTKDCEEEMMGSPNWVKFALDLPLAQAPGTQWAYTSANPMIVGGIIAKTAHMSIMDFAARYLFQPLGIVDYRWTIDPARQGMTAGSFFLRPADMLKLGQLVANHGLWQGQRIVSAHWLQESTAANILIPQFSFVGSSRTKAARPQPTHYGYYWYREQVVTPTSSREVLFASGNGGQYIMLIESLDLVVVFTGGNYNSWKSKLAFEALAKYIIPAF
jgi:CubicO group peptidase (beta-lactamase class C family)